MLATLKPSPDVVDLLPSSALAAQLVCSLLLVYHTVDIWKARVLDGML
jgi:hypothetical protein